MPAPKKRKDGPKQKKAPPKPPKLTMMEIRNRYMEETPPLPYHDYPDERCFIEQYRRPLAYVPEHVVSTRSELEKDHARYMNKYWQKIRIDHKKQVALRDRALRHLQSVNSDLYCSAISFNFNIFPSTFSGLKETMPNPQHTAPLKVNEMLLENEEAIGTNAWLKPDIDNLSEFIRSKKKKARGEKPSGQSVSVNL